jgi:hypothetical protein
MSGLTFAMISVTDILSQYRGRVELCLKGTPDGQLRDVAKHSQRTWVQILPSFNNKCRPDNLEKENGEISLGQKDVGMLRAKTLSIQGGWARSKPAAIRR